MIPGGFKMHHFFEAITNTSGQSLIGYFARVIDPGTLNTVTLSADDNGTPIITVSGVANMGVTDEYGNLSFYVEPGTYHLDIYASDSTTFVYRVSNVPMNSSKGDTGDPGAQGDVGASDASFTTLAGMKAINPTAFPSPRLAATSGADGGVANGLFNYQLGNFTGRTDVVQVNGIPLTTGALVRQADAAIAALQAGGVSRPLDKRLEDTPLNPLGFGAIGSMMADDTAAIRATLAAAKITGQIVSMTKMHVISGQIELDYAKMRVRGDGGGMIKKAGTTGRMLNITGEGVEVYGLILDASTPDQPGSGPSNDIIQIGSAANVKVEYCTLTGSIEQGGSGIANYSGPAALIAFNTINNVRDNSVFAGGPGIDGTRILFNRLDGCAAQNNIFVTASPGSGPVPEVFVYDITIHGNYCRNSGDTNIEAGIHTVRTIITGNNLMTATNPAVLMRDSTYFRVADNIIQATGTRYVDMIAVVPHTEDEKWECFGAINGNTLIGKPQRSGIYVGQSRVKVTNNYISRFARGEAVSAAALAGSGVNVAGPTDNVEVRGNEIFGFSTAIELNESDTPQRTHLGLRILDNIMAYANIGINSRLCVADRSQLIKGNTFTAIRGLAIKGDGSIILPTAAFPNARLRCYDNVFELDGFDIKGFPFGDGVLPSQGLLTSATAAVGIVPEAAAGVTVLGPQVYYGEGTVSIRVISFGSGATYAISASANIASRLVGSTDMLNSDATTAGFTVSGSGGNWNFVRLSTATGVTGPRYFIYDFAAI